MRPSAFLFRKPFSDEDILPEMGENIRGEKRKRAQILISLKIHKFYTLH
jgi:hypothetical protein